MFENKLNLSVLILTHNEEKNIERCLKSLPKESEIVVVDSNSIDSTVEKAKKFGAKVYFESFKDFSSQRNIGLSKLSNDWILVLDADEQLTSLLKERILEIVSTNDQETDIFKIRRQLVFMGKPLKFGKTSDHPIRLFRKCVGLQYQYAIHEQPVYNAKWKVGYLNQQILHYSYHSLEEYFSKFNRYTSAVAASKDKKPSLLGHCMRPLVDFFVRYFFRLGFLDGYRGYVYALISSVYAFVKYAKVYESYAKKES